MTSYSMLFPDAAKHEALIVLAMRACV